MGNLVESIEQKYVVGQPILEKFFNLNKKDLLIKLKDILGDKYEYILENNPRVTKTCVDDEASEIKLDAYDCLIIDFMGISFKREHGGASRVLDFYDVVKLSETFKNL